ncbi:hypothetical protein [Flavobacterium soyangense]|uniref:Uncharacterized protein n=1 Tax=Flavobacterium soyangense TaxID=2023265 RepID=A0A930UDB5_9FLAO|nr:hypothetical protein [Flavobacterium soyangense]MBF2708762.1 hypothetical protein [Flavobacterium soyangense]
MKRLNNIYSQITSIDNLRIAEAKARKGKANQYGVKIYEFFAAAEIMFPIIKKAFYPNATYADFTNTFNYTAFIDKDKNYNFHFYKGETKYRFLSSR